MEELELEAFARFEVREVFYFVDGFLIRAVYIEISSLDDIVGPIAANELFGVSGGMNQGLTMGKAVDGSFSDENFEL